MNAWCRIFGHRWEQTKRGDAWWFVCSRCDEAEPESVERARVFPPDGGMPDPASLTPEESARWAEALDGRHRPIPPEGS